MSSPLYAAAQLAKSSLYIMCTYTAVYLGTTNHWLNINE